MIALGGGLKRSSEGLGGSWGSFWRVCGASLGRPWGVCEGSGDLEGSWGQEIE